MKRCSKRQPSVCRWALRGAFVCAGFFAATVWILTNNASAQTPRAPWIWAREHQPGAVPPGECHFRKEFRTEAPQRAVLSIQADDDYIVYVNGKMVQSGSHGERPEQIDISRYIKRGGNLVAVQVVNRNGNTAGLSAQVMIQERGGKWVAHATGPSWKYNLHPLPFWNSPLYNDRGWKSAQTFNRAEPSSVQGNDVLANAPRQPTLAAPTQRTASPQSPTRAEAPTKKVAAQPVVAEKPEQPAAVAKAQPDASGRFTVPDEFEVTELLDAKAAGSLLAMTFNEFGQIVASREGEGLILASDKDRDGTYETVRTYCDKVKNCQGLLCLNGEVYVTADGPDGAALYRLADADEDGVLENVQAVVKFRGEIGEHGPHGLVLGPDGMLYVIVGNHTAPVTEYEADSPHRHYYEGDLIGPRYEDPGGHANGIKAPGGVVLRTDVEGKRVSLVAGGIRNAYDLTFNREGDLFVHDSDMESDIGTSWYRPTQLYHVTSASEFGWRSGWAKWPDYYVDCLPAVADTGRGSPTGAVAYNHHMFPARYHNALFLGDWSEGRIIAVLLTREGATYAAKTENFLEGRPLNVTDLDVGPDGALYFCTGGRGTDGGLYRVAWKGKVPPNVQNLGKGIEAVIRQPQLHSAWSRQEIARKRRDLADQWDRLVKGVARSKSNPWQYRVRALDVMMLYGPRPDAAFLITLAKDTDFEVRAKAAELLERHQEREARDCLQELLSDDNACVRRKAAEALTAQGREVPLNKLEKMLTSNDRFEAWAARRLLELSDPQSYRVEVLQTENPRLFIQGATAILIARPSKEDAEDVIQRTLTLMEGYVSDRDFIDMLRVVQLALIRGEFSAADAPDVRQAMEREFPANHPRMNRELVRLLAYLDASSIADRYLAYLRSPKAEYIDKLHLALHLRFLNTPLSENQRLELLGFYEDAAQREGGGSYGRYIQNVAVDYARTFSVEDGLAILERGDEFPTSAIGVLYNLPPKLDDATRQLLIDLEGRISTEDSEAYERLQLGLVAVFARSGDADSMAHLRSMWDRSPERRGMIAMGLAQQPGGANWEYLLKSLPILEGDPARTVLTMLRTVPYGPNDPEHYRQAIFCGLRLKENGATEAVALLDYWTSAAVTPEGEGWEASLAAWQKWFNVSYPDHPSAELPTASAESKHQIDDLMEYLASADSEEASATRGAVIFEKAQCAKCHRYGGLGKGLGPDLTSVGRRFSRREILESILFPSHVISDQYMTKAIVTTGGRKFTGMVGAGADQELTVLMEDGRTVTIAKDQVDEMVTVKKSVMPEGLLNEWEREDVADLIEFLTSPPSTTVATPPLPVQTR